MSQHFFASGEGIPSYRVLKRLELILHRLDVGISWVNDRHHGRRHWLHCENRGQPFDGQKEQECYQALEEAGLWPIPIQTGTDEDGGATGELGERGEHGIN